MSHDSLLLLVITAVFGSEEEEQEEKEKQTICETRHGPELREVFDRRNATWLFGGLTRWVRD